MKAPRPIFLYLAAALMLGSCTVFKPKYGCGTSGKNVGAEQIASGDKLPKAKKFRS